VKHDLELFPPSKDDARGYPRWDGSSAQALLQEDMSAGKHKEMTAKKLQNTRQEYKKFPLKVFSDHVEQEKRDALGKSYWLHKKKKNNNKMKGEDDEDDNST
jgi:hypothetical protein